MNKNIINKIFSSTTITIYFVFILGMVLILEKLNEYDLSKTLINLASFSTALVFLVLILKTLFSILNHKHYKLISLLLYNIIFFIISLVIFDLHEEEDTYFFSQVLLICYVLILKLLKIIKK